MPWTETARREYRRDCPRYASDLTDREWALIDPFMPPPRRIGRPRKIDMEAIRHRLVMGEHPARTVCAAR